MRPRGQGWLFPCQLALSSHPLRPPCPTHHCQHCAARRRKGLTCLVPGTILVPVWSPLKVFNTLFTNLIGISRFNICSKFYLTSTRNIIVSSFSRVILSPVKILFSFDFFLLDLSLLRLLITLMAPTARPWAASRAAAATFRWATPTSMTAHYLYSSEYL